MHGHDVFLFDGVRTPRGKGSKKGALASLPSLALVDVLLGELSRRHPALAAQVDDVILGCATQVDGQGTNIARTAVLSSGWPASVPGVTINRFCASGIDAINVAAARVASGDAQLIVAGGVESVSGVPMFADRGPLYCDPALGKRLGTVHMGIAADLAATRDGFSRDVLDAYAFRTREKARAAASARAGAIVPITLADGRRIDDDELVTFAPSRDELAAMEPAFAELGADGQDATVLARFPEVGAMRHLHTRGTSPPLADAAAVIVVGALEAGVRAGLRPRAKIVSTATVAVDPVEMLTGGQLATERAIARAGLTASKVDAFEFAEAFSALCLRFQRDLDVGDDRFNPNGGTLALGHAFGATGAIMVIGVVDQLVRQQGRYGVAAVSGAAGLGVATLIERVD